MAILKDLIVHGGARILNGLNIDTINGSTVGSSPKFTDTTYTAMTASEATTGTATTARSITAAVLAGAITERVPQATTTTPKVDGTASAGSETKWAKGDHVHPTDTSRAAVASPTLTGTPKAPTATAGTNTTQIATTEFVQTAVSTASGNYVPITRKVNDKALSADISLTATDIGLGNVGNFKAVSTVASQGLSTTEQANARANIGAGTSSLAIGTTSSTAAAGNHTHGNITNAGALQSTDVAIASGDKLVVTDSSNSNKIARTSTSFDGSTTTTALTPKGTFETFLKSYTETDPTVPAWAKEPTKPTYTAAEVGLGNVGNFKAVSTVASQGLTTTEQANARANIGAGTSSLTIGTTSSTAAAGNHSHGNITNGGDITSASVTVANNDAIVINDDSASKLANGPVFDGSTTTKALTPKGTWETFLQSETSLSKGTTTGSGNAVTDISVSGHQITLTKGTTFLTSHQTIKQDGVTGATVNRFGTCTIAAGTAAKTVSVTTGTFSLEAGARVSVKFNNANTANSPTLNVNSTGAKNVFHKGSQITSGSNKALLAGVCDFIYDGTQWHLVGNYIDTDTQVTYSTTAPLMDGTAAVGTATTVSRSDHVHPSDTSRVPTTRKVNNKALSSDITLTASDVGAAKTESVTTATLAVASWSSGAYSFTSTYPDASYDIAVEPDGNSITAAQYEAWTNAKIVGNSASNTIKALGTVPTVAIPVVIRVMPK